VKILAEWVQVLPTARIDRAHSDRARSASKGSIWPAPFPEVEKVACILPPWAAKEKATVSGGLFLTPPSIAGRSGAGWSLLRAGLSFPPGGPEALWRDLGEGMGTHRASVEAKANTGLKHEGHL